MNLLDLTGFVAGGVVVVVDVEMMMIMLTLLFNCIVNIVICTLKAVRATIIAVVNPLRSAATAGLSPMADHTTPINEGGFLMN
jgi:hypothetical protein